ncbi:hypothetical protein GCM10011514_45360 [Emticicia aquatilis]|uniref:DUF2007 domain-containing protein n=1 Tax=Emticicia aquatilis TaxID=1537369 RepID=A0A916Z4E9_9BACT|nr:hypothetical protein [Emticicia aquatilis]GGD76284.1 hypothetical protein GCM10011514_45360 [Emticicia aquatilis]
MEEFKKIKSFNDEAQFNDLLEILKRNDIPFQTEAYRERMDSVSLISLPPEFIVKVTSDKFARVFEILDEVASKEVFEVDKSHYLFTFSDEELYDLLAKPDEWSAFDYQLAQKILGERGKQVDKEFLKSLKKARIEALAKPEPKQGNNIRIGYAFALLGGLIGIAIGWNMMTSKKILPNGEQIYSYQEVDRKHGKRIVILGSIMFVVAVILRIMSQIVDR